MASDQEKHGIVSIIGFSVAFSAFGALLGIGVNRNFFELKSLNPVFHQTFFTEHQAVGLVLIFAFGMLVLTRLLIYLHSGSGLDSRRLSSAVAPLGLFCLYLFGIPHGFWEPILFVAVCSWVVYRIALLVKLPTKIPAKKCSPRISILIVSGLFVLFTVYGFTIQRKALDVMYLTFYDWGEFLTIANNSLHGKWFMTNVDVPAQNFLSKHFMPGSLLLLIGWTKIFPGTNALFFLNAAVLYSMPVLGYVFARKLKLSRASALVLSIVAFLSPSLANLVLSSCHGFHLIYFMLPLVLLFFIFLERKQYIALFVIFLFSLTFKETVGAFWLGVGVVLWFMKYRRTGVAVSIVGGVGLLLVVKIIMPFFPGLETYKYVERYSHLGTSISDIALSPFLRPAVFFGSFFRADCIYFLILLLLPVFPLVLRRIWILLGASVTLLFICIQQSTMFQNIAYQYQTYAVVLAYIAALYAVQDITRNRPCRWFDCTMNFGINAGFSRRRRLFAALSATLCSALLCNCFFAENDWSKNSFNLQRKKKDWTKEIAEIRSLIPQHVAINATYHLAPHFISRNDVYASLDGPLDYVLLDLDDPYNYPHKLMNLRKKLLESDKYDVAYNRAFRQNHFMLFIPAKGTPKNKRTPRIFHLTDKQWPFTGNEVKVPGIGDFSFRAALHKDNNRRYIMLFTRLKRRVDYDIKITAVISDGFRQLFYANYFGDALQPAYMQRPGDVYLMLLPIPADWPHVKSCQVKIDRKQLR